VSPDRGDRSRQLSERQAIGYRQIVGVADRRIQDVEVEVKVADGIGQLCLGQEVGEVAGDLADLNHSDGRLPQECGFGRIEIPGAQEEGGLRLDR
jgi:hypothetical protein